MKKLSRKLLAVLLTATMIMAMSLTSFAKTQSTYSVTFNINQTNGNTVTSLASSVQVTVDSGETVYDAVNKLTAYSPQFIDVYDNSGTYSYSYLSSMTFGTNTLTGGGTSTPSTPGDWTHGHYEGWDWEYYVNGTYASTYMTSNVITSDCTITLNYAYNSFDW